jgi:hypothetical protein
VIGRGACAILEALMYLFIQNIISSPYAIIVTLLSLAAAFAFITFLRGFLSGFKQLTTINENSEELEHFRTYAMWGALQLIFFFGLWETIRFGLGYLWNEPTPGAAPVTAAFAIWGALYLLKMLFSPKKSGGGH